MRSNNLVLMAIVFVALAALSCQAVSNLAGGEGALPLEDDFSSPGWGTGTDADSSVEYANEALQMIVNTKNWFVWSTPNDYDYEKTHIEVTATNNDSDPTTAFGIICHQQVEDDSFYYFAVTPAGQYAIAEASLAASDIFLTNEDKWEYSDFIENNADSYRIGVHTGPMARRLTHQRPWTATPIQPAAARRRPPTRAVAPPSPAAGCGAAGAGAGCRCPPRGGRQGRAVAAGR